MKSKIQFKKLILILLVFTFSSALAFGQNCGDVNLDEVTDIVDALLVAQCYVGIASCPSAEIGDVNCDGEVDIVDALLVAQFYVGLIDTLSCCSTPPPVTPGPTPVSGEAIGFGRFTTGGEGGPEITVTSIGQLIEAAASEGPLIINVQGNLVHNVSGGSDDARISIASNKTIQGAGGNASVDANFVNAREDESCSNIIIRNLYLSNPEGKGTGDAIEFTNGVTNIWVDHVTFGQCKDGALDFKRGADLATVSWCKFAYTDPNHDHNYANLVGHSDNYPELDRGKLKVTFHHNWWAENVIERMPRVRYGQVHVFNNYYSSNRTHYNVGVGVEAQILFEGNYLENQNGANGSWYDWYPANKCDHDCAPGKIEWRDNVWDNSTMSTWAENSDVFDPPYEYAKQSAVEAKASVMAYAGVVRSGISYKPIE